MDTFDSKLFALRRHVDEARRHPRRAEAALRDLYFSLVSSSGEMLDCEGKRLVQSLANEGAISSVTGAMSRPCASPRLVYRALGVLTLFAQQEARLVGSQGGFEAILFAMRQFPDTEFVHEAAIVALVECGRRSMQYASDVRGVLALLARTMETFKHSPRIFYLACTAIRIASQSGIILDDEMANKIYGNLLDGIILFPSDAAAQNAGREVLALWVGFDNALEMIRLRASALLALADIIHRATGLVDQPQATE